MNSNRIIRLAFIGCSKTKLPYKSKARNLYQGALFKKSLAYCEEQGFSIFILSAKYGIIKPSDIIEPYELTLNNMTRTEIRLWYSKVDQQMIEYGLHIIPPENRYFFCGEKYHFPFQGNKPLAGLSIGRMLQWFKIRTKSR